MLIFVWMWQRMEHSQKKLLLLEKKKKKNPWYLDKLIKNWNHHNQKKRERTPSNLNEELIWQNEVKKSSNFHICIIKLPTCEGKSQ